MKGLKAGFFCLAVFFCACTNRESVPSGIIEPDSMQVILADVVAADHFSSEYVMRDTLRKDTVHRDVVQYTKQLYETVFKLHHISRDEFKTSLDFYYSRPDLLKKMFDSLAAKENRHRNELYKKGATVSPHAAEAQKALPHPLRKDSLAADLKRDSLLHALRKDSAPAPLHKDSLPASLRQKQTDSLAAARHLILKQKPGFAPQFVRRDSVKKIAHPLRRDSVNSVGHH